VGLSEPLSFGTPQCGVGEKDHDAQEGGELGFSKNQH
jgi:hypothetical protein